MAGRPRPPAPRSARCPQTPPYGLRPWAEVPPTPPGVGRCPRRAELPLRGIQPHGRTASSPVLQDGIRDGAPDERARLRRPGARSSLVGAPGAGVRGGAPLRDGQVPARPATGGTFTTRRRPPRGIGSGAPTGGPTPARWGTPPMPGGVGSPHPRPQAVGESGVRVRAAPRRDGQVPASPEAPAPGARDAPRCARASGGAARPPPRGPRRGTRSPPGRSPRPPAPIPCRR